MCYVVCVYSNATHTAIWAKRLASLTEKVADCFPWVWSVHRFPTCFITQNTQRTGEALPPSKKFLRACKSSAGNRSHPGRKLEEWQMGILSCSSVIWRDNNNHHSLRANLWQTLWLGAWGTLPFSHNNNLLE
jgi:hypothetical protein